MPRRAAVIALLALFSLGLLSVRPVIAQTTKPVPPTPSELASLKEEMAQFRREFAEDRTAREKFGLKMEALKNKVEGWHLNTKTIGDWVNNYFILVLATITVLVAGFGWVLQGFFRREVKMVQDLGSEVIEFREKAEELIEGLRTSIEQATTITDALYSSRAEIDQSLRALDEQRAALDTTLEELEQRKVQIDKDIDRREKEAVAAIDEETKFSLFMMEASSSFKDGHYEAALKASGQALEINSKSPVAWSNKGVALNRLGRNKEALEAQEKALSIDEESPIAWSNKAAVLGDLGRYEEALEAYEKAIGFDPNDATARSNKGADLVSMDRPEEALDVLGEALTLDPNHPRAWFHKARAHSQLGEKDEMLDALKKAIELEPKVKEEAKTDEDFDPFREDEDFRALVYGEEQ